MAIEKKLGQGTLNAECVAWCIIKVFLISSSFSTPLSKAGFGEANLMRDTWISNELEGMFTWCQFCVDSFTFLTDPGWSLLMRLKDRNGKRKFIS